MVTKVSDVRPIINVACYFCEVCGFEVYHTVIYCNKYILLMKYIQVTSKTYMPLVECPGPICKQNNTKGKLIQNIRYFSSLVKLILFYIRASKFLPYQDIKIQETPDQIPKGNIPRSFNIVAKGEVTRQCTPGDIVIIIGVFLPSQFESSRYSNNTKLIHVKHYHSSLLNIIYRIPILKHLRLSERRKDI